MVVKRFLSQMGYEAAFVDTLSEGRALLEAAVSSKRYPVVLTPRDTSGEKEVEIFVGHDETIVEIGLSDLVAVTAGLGPHGLGEIITELAQYTSGERKARSSEEIMRAIQKAVPNFKHIGGTHTLDDRF